MLEVGPSYQVVVASYVEVKAQLYIFADACDLEVADEEE